MQIQNTRRRTSTLHYTKDRKPSLKSKTACVQGKPYSIYRQRGLLEDETGPRVEDRRVAPPFCRGNAVIAAFPRQYQGQKSLVLPSASPSLLGLSWYILFLVFLAGYSSDMRKGLNSMHLLEIPLLGVFH